MAWLGALPPDPQDLSLWGQDGSQQGTNKRRNRTFHLSKKPDILTCQEQYFRGLGPCGNSLSRIRTSCSLRGFPDTRLRLDLAQYLHHLEGQVAGQLEIGDGLLQTGGSRIVLTRGFQGPAQVAQLLVLFTGHMLVMLGRDRSLQLRDSLALVLHLIY